MGGSQGFAVVLHLLGAEQSRAQRGFAGGILARRNISAQRGTQLVYEVVNRRAEGHQYSSCSSRFPDRVDRKGGPVKAVK
jgi:hypothetical protein